MSVKPRVSVKPRDLHSAEQAEAVLDQLIKEMADTDAHLAGLRDDRRVVLRYLLDHGRTQAALAARCGVSPMAIADTLNRVKAKEGSASPRPTRGRTRATG